MAKEILTDIGFWMDQYNLRGNMNTAAIDGTVETRDCTSFGDGFRNYQLGMKTAEFSAAGFMDDSVDKFLFDEWGTSGNVLTVTKDWQLGSVAFVGKILDAAYSPSMTMSELWSFNFAASLSERSFGRGRLMERNTNLIATGNGTARQLRAISVNKAAFATLHVLSVAGTASPTVACVIESSTVIGMTTPTVRATFTSMNAIGGQMQQINGPITDTFYRVRYTVTGTAPVFSVVVAMGFEETF